MNTDKRSHSSPISTMDAMAGFMKQIKTSPFRIAPESSERLYRDLFGGRPPELRESYTEANFYAIPEDHAIHVSYSGLASLWLLSYVALWLAGMAGRSQREHRGQRESIDISTAASTINVGEHLAYARELFHADRPWPLHLRRPNSTAPLESMEGKINNLFLGALSWILLHEIGHVVRQDSRWVPKNISHQQEYAADGFATKWVLESAGVGLQREFRVLAVCVALAWLLLSEQARGRGTTHPPAIRRLDEAIQHFGLGERSVGLEYAGYIFKAIFDPTAPAPGFDTPKAWFGWVVGRLHEIFPA